VNRCKSAHAGKSHAFREVHQLRAPRRAMVSTKLFQCSTGYILNAQVLSKSASSGALESDCWFGG